MEVMTAEGTPHESYNSGLVARSRRPTPRLRRAPNQRFIEAHDNYVRHLGLTSRHLARALRRAQKYPFKTLASTQGGHT